MSATLTRDGPTLRTPLVASALLHVLFAGALIATRPTAMPPAPPSYRVNLIAAPPGERRIATDPAPVAAPPTPAPTVKAATTAKPKVVASKAPPRTVATPSAGVASPKAPVAPAPAAGGPQGGKGGDVANVKIDGPAFPYQGYLDNIVRQIAVNFKPAARGALQAEVSFLIRRDGSIYGLRITRRSSVYSFDQDALAAVELASRSFGALPSGFADDVLPVIFTFDPRLIR